MMRQALIVAALMHLATGAAGAQQGVPAATAAELTDRFG